jgi:hypothetical protein
VKSKAERDDNIRRRGLAERVEVAAGALRAHPREEGDADIFERSQDL